VVNNFVVACVWVFFPSLKKFFLAKYKKMSTEKRKFASIPTIVKDVIEFLRSKGHTCPFYNLSEQKLKWCHQDHCQDVQQRQDVNKRLKKQDDFLEKLKNQGHTCIELSERMPAKIRWCEQERCIES
jgi:hypothetical protein